MEWRHAKGGLFHSMTRPPERLLPSVGAVAPSRPGPPTPTSAIATGAPGSSRTWCGSKHRMPPTGSARCSGTVRWRSCGVGLDAWWPRLRRLCDFGHPRARAGRGGLFGSWPAGAGAGFTGAAVGRAGADGWARSLASAGQACHVLGAAARMRRMIFGIRCARSPARKAGMAGGPGSICAGHGRSLLSLPWCAGSCSVVSCCRTR